MVCGGDEVCNDDFHIRQELVNTRDSRFLFQQTYAINATNDVGIGWCFEASFASVSVSVSVSLPVSVSVPVSGS
jgi:hypothetical protein